VEHARQRPEPVGPQRAAALGERVESRRETREHQNRGDGVVLDVPGQQLQGSAPGDGHRAGQTRAPARGEEAPREAGDHHQADGPDDRVHDANRLCRRPAEGPAQGLVDAQEEGR
jgi:hypothetical protein